MADDKCHWFLVWHNSQYDNIKLHCWAAFNFHSNAPNTLRFHLRSSACCGARVSVPDAATWRIIITQAIPLWGFYERRLQSRWWRDHIDMKKYIGVVASTQVPPECCGTILRPFFSSWYFVLYCKQHRRITSSL